MKKIISLFVLQFFVITVFGVVPETIEDIFKKLHANQPIMEEIRFPRGTKTKEELKQLNEKLDTYKIENIKRKNKLIEIACTNNYIKNAIAEELLKYSKKNINRSISDVFYQTDLLFVLEEVDIHKVFECANIVINNDEYVGGAMFESGLRIAWRRGNLTAEEVRPFFINLAKKRKNKEAAKILLGSKYHNPLDKTTGEQIVRSWIEEETNVDDKLKYYRILDSAGIKDSEHINILKSIIDNPDMPLLSKSIYAKQLEWIGATNNPIIKEEVDSIKIEYKQERLKLRSGGEEALIRTSPDQPITNAEGRIYHIIK